MTVCASVSTGAWRPDTLNARRVPSEQEDGTWKDQIIGDSELLRVKHPSKENGLYSEPERIKYR